MPGFTSFQKKILRNHTKAIVHMRNRLSRKKFSLVFGSGISIDFHVPDWDTLLEEIAGDPQVRGISMLRRNKDQPHGPKTQVLFHHFARKLQAKSQNRDIEYGEVKSQWREIVRKYLYKNADKDIDKIVEEHSYLKAFINIIKNSPMTVNYNFDDYIEKVLHKQAPDPSSEHVRDFETVWNPQLQTKLDECVIYHPNGFLPESTMERQSEGLVFCEDEFADQLIETMAGRYASLLHHYSQNTCLFLGLSLNDSTLKHLLRQAASLNPGHYHYYVAFTDKNEKISEAERKAISEANFNLYNLVTLFLSREEIREFGYLLDLPSDEFIQNAVLAEINLVYSYYIIGAIGAGKSTLISYFRNLVTHDEWPDFRLPELGKSCKKLDPDEERKIDDWINTQFKKKNGLLSKCTSGLHIIDRAPLDPIAFKKKQKRRRRAKSLMENICEAPDGAKIRGGQVIILVGEPDVLEQRARANGKDYTSKGLNEMQDILKRVYRFKGKTSFVESKNRPTEQIVKEVGKIIHKEDYKEVGLHRRLMDIKNGRFKC